jgi:pimeloyl-ACP methyl ester carboxylesterase
MRERPPRRHEIERIPWVTVFQEQAGFKDTYGGDEGWVVTESMLIRPVDRPSKIASVWSHPIGGGAFLPIMGALAHAGHHVVFCNGRYRGNDSALIMEKCVVDLGAAIRDLRKRFGYERIVLGGWSGGGSLALFYQEQAVRPSVTATPAGDPPDLTREELVPGEALLIVAAHVSRAVTLTECLDPSIRDEQAPERRDPALDLYADGREPPYPADFLTRYRAAQLERNRRITASVREKLEALRVAGRPHDEHCFVVQGTNADPRWLDATIDPNERTPGTSWLGDPRISNTSPIGLARYTSLRSWLSQWSLDASNAHGERNAASLDVPALVVGNGADEVCTPSHLDRLHAAIPHDRKRRVTIPGARHYYAGQPEELADCVAHCGAWLEDHGLVD